MNLQQQQQPPPQQPPQKMNLQQQQQQPPPQQPPQPPYEKMYKNRLQEYVQRSALPLPSYHTIKEGVAQFGTFTSTVYVDGIAYKSSKAFSRSKDAEQDAAKVALKSILMKLKDEGCTLINEDIAFCKSILNEFAVKMSLQKPAYTTTQAPGILPIFTSTLVFHGKTYTGKPRRSKKDAEQLVARSVIESILGSESGRHLSQIIITKRKLYATVHNASDNVLIPSSENSAEIENDSEPHLAFQPTKKPKVEHICETTSDPTENEAPLLEQSPCADQGRTASTSGTK